MSRNAIPFAFALVVLALACSKGEKSQEGSAATAAGDTAASAPVVASYRAFGNEPFWSVLIDAAGLRFTSPEDTAGVRFPPVEAMVAGDTLRWSAASERGAIDVRIWPAVCRDGMSDETWRFASLVRLDATTYHGCAGQVTGTPER